MARYEVEDLPDKESLCIIFTAVVSFIALLVAVISQK